MTSQSRQRSRPGKPRVSPRPANAPDPDQPHRPTDLPSDPPASGTGSSDAEFLADPGPAFDPRQAPPAPELEDELDVLEAPEEWTEQQIREFLKIQGQATHWVLKVGPEDTDTWKHTEDDLSAIAPPLTRILNRYDMTRAAAAAGDEILLGTAVFSYATRNVTRRRLLLARRADQGPQPVTGVPAPPDSGPETDESWQGVRPVDLERPPAIVPKGSRR